jgi:hypothetical protein
VYTGPNIDADGCVICVRFLFALKGLEMPELFFNQRAHFDSYFHAVGIGETGLPRRRFDLSTGVIRFSFDSQAIRYTPWLRLRV